MVVETARLARARRRSSSKTLASGWAAALARTTRLGSEPARARRRSIRYSYSGEPSAGRKYGGWSASRASSGISSCRCSRSRNVAQLLLGHLLDLVGGVAGLEVGAERPALDGLGQDDRGRALVLDGGLVGGVELAVVVAAAGQGAQVVVGEVLDHGPQAGVGAEEVLADVGAGLDRVLLELAVEGGVHLVERGRRRRRGPAARPTSSPR